MDKLTFSNEHDKITNQSEERLLALMKATSDVIYRMSPDWKTMTELYGRGFLTDTDGADPCWLDKYIHPNDQAHVFEVIENCISKKQVFELEHRVLKADGSIGWTHSRAVPLFDKNGDIKEWIGAASDITERKRAVEALQNEHKRFFDVLETLPAMICLITPDYHIPFANKAFREKFGEANGRYCYDYCCGYTQPCTFCEALIPLKTGRPHQWEFTSPDGKKIFDVHDFPFIDTDGTTLILETDIDITEHKRTEEKLKLQANLLSSVHDGIIAVDENMTITYWNESAEKITGWSVSEAIGQSGKEIFAHLKVDRLWGEMTADLDRLGYYYREVWANRKDGELFYADLHMKRIFGHDGTFRGTITTFRDITRRRKMEVALKASEEMLRTVLDMSLDGIYRFNYMTGLFDYLSSSAAGILGYSVEELLNINKAGMHAMVHPDDVPCLLAEIGHLEITGEATAEYRQKHKNGTFVWMSNHMSIVRDDKGSPVYRYGNLRDITERKRAEGALRESEERYRGVIQNTSAVILRVNPQGIITFANKRALEFFGYAEDEFVGKPVLGTFVPERESTGRDLVKMVEEIMTDPDRFHTNANENMRKGGERVWMEWTNSGVYDGEGRLKEFLAVGIDATDRKRAEDALRESETQLESDLKATKLLQNISTQMLYEDNIQVLYEKIVDTAMQIMHSDFGSLQVFHRDWGECGALKLMVHNGFTPQATEFWDWVDFKDNTTCSLAMKNGSIIVVPDMEKWVLSQGTEDLAVYLQTGIRACQSTPLVSRNGELLGMFSTHWRQPYTPTEREIDLMTILARQAADLVERKKMEEKQHDSEMRALALVSELEKADQNKNQFISVLSHELRNPLAAILAGIQLLDVARDINKASKVKEIINRQTNQLCKLVDDLLELTRISQNKIKLKKENINLNEILKNAVEDIRHRYEKKGIKLESKILPPPLLLNADPVRITQIIGNVLNNALKFTQANGAVWLTLKVEKDYAVIIVKDNGIGINPEILPHIFEPFTQADNTLERSNGGLGLGLSIVKCIVDLHNGNVNAFSDGLGKGSTFTIRLPITSGDNLMMETQTPDKNGKNGLKLLIIEDSRDLVDLLSTMLSTMGYSVDIAYDGIDGVKLAKQIKPDVIFCDIGLPGMNGYDVSRSIRSIIELKDVNLIALTGYAGEGDAECALKAGFNRHLTKPVDFAVLKSILSALHSD